MFTQTALRSFQRISKDDLKECQNTHSNSCWQNNAINVNPKPPQDGFARFEIPEKASRFVASVDKPESACTAWKSLRLYIEIDGSRVYTASWDPYKEINIDVARLPDAEQARDVLDIAKSQPRQFKGGEVQPGSMLTVAASGQECTVNYRNARFLISSR